MANGLSRLAKLRARRDPEGTLWDSTILPRIQETLKLAQANVTNGAPPTVAGPAAAPDAPVTPSPALSGLRQYSKYIPQGMNYLAENQRLAPAVAEGVRSVARGNAPRAVATANAPLIKEEAGNWATATPERAQQLATQHGGVAGQVGSAWSKLDNTIKQHPVLGALAMANPLTAIPAVAANISAHTGAGDAALNKGIRTGVNQAVDQGIQKLPNTPVNLGIPTEAHPVAGSTIDYLANTPQALTDPKVQTMMQGLANNPGDWRQTALNNVPTIQKYGPQIAQSNPAAVSRTALNYARKSPVAGQYAGLVPSISNFGVENAQEAFNMPGLVEGAIKGDPKTLENNLSGIQSMAQRYHEANPDLVRPYAEKLLQDRRAQGDTGANMANMGLEVAEAFGGQAGRNKLMDAGVKQQLPGVVQSMVTGKPLVPQATGTQSQAPAQGGWMQDLAKNIGFEHDPARGWLGSFLNNKNNGKFRWGAGGIGLMGLLWLLSRMGRR